MKKVMVYPLVLRLHHILFLLLFFRSNSFILKAKIHPLGVALQKESGALKDQNGVCQEALCRRRHVQELAGLIAGCMISTSPLFPIQPALAVAAFTNNKEATTEDIGIRDVKGGKLFSINDPNTYSGLVYLPNSIIQQQASNDNNDMDNDSKTVENISTKKYPVIVVLHGAGKNELDVWNLADPKGEHAGLIPSLLNSDKGDTGLIGGRGGAPNDLFENFIVTAPYSFGKRSFYEEPRSKILQFVKWACVGGAGGLIDKTLIDTNRLFLFGFSDGATLGVELMTTNTFQAGVFAAYGFTGKLPKLALERLQGKPMWIFHSADDVIFPVECSDRLVKALRDVNNGDIIKYSRFDYDQEGFTGSVRGHSTGITASKNPDVYKWLLSL